MVYWQQLVMAYYSTSLQYVNYTLYTSTCCSVEIRDERWWLTTWGVRLHCVLYHHTSTPTYISQTAIHVEFMIEKHGVAWVASLCLAITRSTTWHLSCEVARAYPLDSAAVDVSLFALGSWVTDWHTAYSYYAVNNNLSECTSFHNTICRCHLHVAITSTKGIMQL